MNLSAIVKAAIEQRATDIHLEPAMNIVIRANSSLRRMPQIVSADFCLSCARQVLSEDDWTEFESRGSFDTTRVMAGVNCRINVMKTDRGIGLAIRLLNSASATLRSCNLHPQLAKLVEQDAGLILFTGPTGSGKSTTLAAMLEEINATSQRHIITLESPIEYRITPKKSLVRQREVGVHTSSFEQGLLDTLREDPDVIVVGEMREAEVMRLTLSAAETGHLVMATMHASNSADAVYRMMMSFAPERQNSVLAQLGDSLIAIITQKMSFREEQQLMVPVLEITMASHAVKNAVRKGEATKLISLLQAGGPDGSWTFERYETWLDQKTDWVRPEPPTSFAEDTDPSPEADVVPMPAPRRPTAVAQPRPAAGRPTSAHAPAPAERATTLRSTSGASAGAGTGKKTVTKINKDGRFEIPDADFDFNSLANDIAKSIDDRDDDES